MLFRTDLALEAKQDIDGSVEGILCTQKKSGQANITTITIETETASQKIGKPKGHYITVEVPALTDHFTCVDERIEIIADQLKSILPEKGLILVAGLGNSNITPDALGPKSAAMVLATRHITGEIARATGLDALRPTAVLSPGVLGQTGVETGELLFSVVKHLKPVAVIAIDALASRELARLGCTIQISDAGISPGSGIGNTRPQINKETLGVPVIGMGVPTVVDATTLAYDLFSESDQKNPRELKQKVSPRGEMMMVTPREIDLLIERSAKLIGMAINCALHPDYSAEDLFSLVS